MAGYCSMGSFSFHCFAVRRNKKGSHEAQGTEALCNAVALYIAIIVLTGPYKVAVPFEGAGNHIIYEAVFIHDACLLKLLFEFSFIDIGENIFEPTVVFFEDSILGA